MKPNSKQEALLNDVFGEGEAFRETLLAQSVRQSRRGYRFRQARRATALLAVIGLAAVVIRENAPARREPRPTEAASYTLVHTSPLAAGAIITTRPQPEGKSIAATEAVPVVRTVHNNFRLIDDAELLTLMAPRRCGLIRIGPNAEELVFVNGEQGTGDRE